MSAASGTFARKGRTPCAPDVYWAFSTRLLFFEPPGLIVGLGAPKAKHAELGAGDRHGRIAQQTATVVQSPLRHRPTLSRSEPGIRFLI
jgi:hypothetical protein